MRLREVLCGAIFSGIVILSCKYKTNEKKETATGTEEGFRLAKQHCSTCHSFVEATVLDSVTWKDHVLPNMAPMLGIRVLWGKEYVEQKSSNSAVSFKDWLKIESYYTKTAPRKLDLPKPIIPSTDTRLFNVKKTKFRFQNPTWTVLTTIDTVTGNIYTSDGSTNTIYKWNRNLNIIDSVKTYSPSAHVYFVNDPNKRHAVFTTMGTMEPSETSNGDILQFNADGKLNKPTDTFATNLPRPVQTVPADFNNDHLTDLLVCGFGRTTGGLFLLENQASGGYLGKVITPLPGATQAIVEDFNKDGWNDIMVLFAHSEESVRLLTNNKKGGFDQAILLKFPPVYGSTSFQLTDINNDGLKDIIYTCGDNADISQILKPFHGVYIYMNKGNNKYEQQYFYHINGCTKAIARDFDLDGDIDIATIAFYSDYRNNPAETFILLRQDSPMKFQPISPGINKEGRWMTMDAADIDKDGDDDIVLGNFAESAFFDKNFMATWQLRQPFILLENKTR